MDISEVLVVGRHEEIMTTILRLINSKAQLKGTAAFSVEEAEELGTRTSFDVVLLGAGLSAAESEAIRNDFTVPVVQHYGGGSGLLFAEIYQALGI